MISLSVSAIGMTTSLGLNSVDACAAARAGLVRLSGITTLNTAIDPYLAKEGIDGAPPLVGHMAPMVATGHGGLAKLLALSRPALAELLQHAALSDEQWARTGLMVALSDNYFLTHYLAAADDDAGADDDEQPKPRVAPIADRFAPQLLAEFNLPCEPQFCAAITDGRMAWIDALQRAAQLIESRRIDRCVVGSVESCVEPQLLQAFGKAGAIKTESQPAGLIPGEAATFILLERSDAHSTTALHVKGIGTANDHSFFSNDARPAGRGIAAAIGQAVATANVQRLPAWALLDLNGIEQRAADWGCALVHLQSQFGSDFSVDHWIPALSFGETGAAAGGVAVCMAYRAALRGYAADRHALVVLSAEDGRRGCVLLEARIQ